jgi:methylated-DNA-protein-cysteine methyltransferase-like protein
MNFEDIIYSAISQVPYGHTVSYGALARLAGFQNHARHVGRLLKNLPKDTKLPWHRVVNSQGKISLPEGSESYTEQRARLLSEGVVIKNNRIPKPFFLG